MPKNYVIQRDLLDKTDEASNQAYLDRALNISEEELKELLDETWLTASEALEKDLLMKF